MIGNKSGAKQLLVLFTLLIALSSEFVDANNDGCEIVRKLKEYSTLAEQDIYKYFCLVKLLQLTPETLAVNKSIRWCDFDKPGGTCNVKCSNLISSDITDNINCAVKLINTAEWMNVAEYCKNYETKTKNCSDELHAFEGLVGSDDQKNNTVQPEPTPLPSPEPGTLVTPISTSSVPTITETSTVTVTTLITTTINSSDSTAEPTTEAITTSTKASPSTDKSGMEPDTVFWIVSLVLFTFIVIVVAVLNRNKSRYRMFQNAPPVTDEFESSLLG